MSEAEDGWISFQNVYFKLHSEAQLPNSYYNKLLSCVDNTYIASILVCSFLKIALKKRYFTLQPQSEKVSRRKRAKGQHLLPFVLAQCSCTGWVIAENATGAL